MFAIICGLILGVFVVACAFMVTPPSGRLGMSFGAATSALIFIPTNLLRDNAFGSSLVPVGTAFCLLLIGVLSAGRHFVMPPKFWIFVTLAASGIVGGAVVGRIDGLTSIWMLFLICLWFIAGNMRSADRSTASWILVASGAVIGVITSLEALVFNEPLVVAVASRYANPLTGGIRGQATLSQPLVAAFVLLGALFLLMYLSAPKGAKVVGGALLLLGIISTGSSSVVAVALIAIGYMVLRSSSGIVRAGWVFALCVAALLVASSQKVLALVADLSPNANEHRLNSILAIPNLIDQRSALEVVFGSGWGSVQRLFERQIFPNDGFFAIDNQYVSVLAFGGMVGAVALTVLVVSLVAHRARPELLMPVVGLLAMGLSFDFLLWPVAAAYVIFFSTWKLAPLEEQATKPTTYPMSLRVPR